MRNSRITTSFAKVIPSPNLIVSIRRCETMKESEKNEEKKDAGAARVCSLFRILFNFFF
jgi:hypothetical protein